MTFKDMIKIYLIENQNKFLSLRKLEPSNTFIGVANITKKFVVKGSHLIVYEEWERTNNTHDI